jgi:hypothetical protein
MLVSRKAHQTQFPATPWVRVKPVTRFGVSVENVVATMDVPKSHHGIDRLDRKNSSELLPERRPAHAPIRTDVAIAPNTRHQSSRLRRTVYLPSAKERVFSIFAKLATLI